MTSRYYAPASPSTRYDPIPAQSKVTYEDYKKIKGFEDVGYLLSAYVVTGGVVTANISRNDTIDTSDIVVSLNNDMMHRESTSFKTKIASTIYYLDFSKDGDFVWGTSHPTGIEDVDYLTIAEVTTDTNKMVDTITDVRTVFNGIKLKPGYDIDGYATDAELAAEIADVDAQLADLAIDVKRLGAKGDANYFNDGMWYVDSGFTTLASDDTEVIQSALDYPITPIRTVSFPNGNYQINPYIKLKLSSNTKIVFSNNAKLVAKKTDEDIYSMLDVVNVENIEIINPTIIGDRDYNTSVAEGAGYGISIRTVTNVRIRNANISDCFTDGIYANNITDGLIEFVTCDNNRRQGMSIISCDNLLVRNSAFKNTNGTAPEMGIDIEPNTENEQLKGLVIENCYTEGNNSSGIGINYNQLDNTSTIVDITIRNCIDKGSKNFATITKYTGDISESSTIKFIDCQSLNAEEAGIQVIGHKSSGTAKITFVRPRVHNPNVSNGTNQRQQDVAISIHAETSGYPTGTNQGNVEFIEPSITMEAGNDVMRGIFIGYPTTDPIRKILIQNPKIIDIGLPSTLSNNNSRNLISFNTVDYEDILITDEFEKLVVTTDFSLIKNFSSGVYSTYNSTLASDVSLTDFQKFDFLNEFTIVKFAAGGTLTVTFPGSTTFIDETNTIITGTLATTTNGGVLRFKKIKANFYKVFVEYGTWS